VTTPGGIAVEEEEEKGDESNGAISFSPLQNGYEVLTFR